VVGFQSVRRQKQIFKRFMEKKNLKSRSKKEQKGEEKK
jgi:hypothetical protein